MLGIIAHDTKKHRRDQIFEDGFDFTLAATRKEMAKQQGGFDKTKVRRATTTTTAAGHGSGGSSLSLLCRNRTRMSSQGCWLAGIVREGGWPICHPAGGSCDRSVGHEGTA